MSNITVQYIPADQRELPKLVGKNNKIAARPLAEYRAMNQTALRLFCHTHARYVLPTTELIDYLKTIIGDRSAIEIGAGAGDLGCQLGIPMTDSYCQTWPDVQLMYAATGQPTIKYGRDVEYLDALAAVEKYQPDVVLAAWVTHWIDPNLPPKPGSMYGVKEDLLLKNVKEYIVVGSTAIHSIKPIMALPHTTIDACDMVVSRSQRGDDKIWIWPGGKNK